MPSQKCKPLKGYSSFDKNTVIVSTDSLFNQLSRKQESEVVKIVVKFGSKLFFHCRKLKIYLEFGHNCAF